MKKLGERLSEKSVQKDDDSLYGELLSTKLRKLSAVNKLRVKNEIDNIMFNYLLQEERSVTSSQSNQSNSVLDSRTPNSSDKTSSPVYAPYHQQKSRQSTLPAINAINQAGVLLQGENGFSREPYTNFFNSPSNEILPGDLFRKFMDNGQHNNK